MPSSTLFRAKVARRKTRSLPTARRKRRSATSFAEGMKPFIGMVKNAPSDLSMREGFGR